MKQKDRKVDKTQEKTDKNRPVSLTRRTMLKAAFPLTLLMASPAHAIDLFKLLDPKNKKDRDKAFKILDGAADVLTSSSELDDAKEFTIGEQLALEGFKRYGLSVKDKGIQKYVNLVGNALAANSTRPEIPYYFVVTESPLYNAFACPGGIIFLTSTLFGSMDDESELAGVLAHELAHVGHKHALQSLKRAKFFEGVAKITAATSKKDSAKMYEEMIGGLQTVLFDQGLDKNMEFEADTTGVDTAYRTGYDPDGLKRVLEMLRKKESGASKKGSWFSTHPPLKERISKCATQSKSYPDGPSMAKVRERFLGHRERL